jgi:hypothetical protein
MCVFWFVFFCFCVNGRVNRSMKVHLNVVLNRYTIVLCFYVQIVFLHTSTNYLVCNLVAITTLATTNNDQQRTTTTNNTESKFKIERTTKQLNTRSIVDPHHRSSITITITITITIDRASEFVRQQQTND